jgi:hypothetical protein
MPHVKDPFQSSLPLTTPTVNYYAWFLGRPELKAWPNYTLHIDPVTGERRRLRFVLDRLEHAATALVSSPSDGGFGFVAGQQSGIVGILSENCLVCSKKILPCHRRPHCHYYQGIPDFRICPA